MSHSVPDHSSTNKGASAAHAGRGGLALAAGKVYFLVAGLVQQVLLNAVLGLGGYGAYSTISSVASISYNPLIQAGIQGVSREVAAVDDLAAPLVQRRLLVVHLGLALGASVLFFGLGAPLSVLLGAPHVSGALRILSLLLFLYAVYAPLIGYLNGRRRFLGQAGLDIFAATLRTVGLVAGAYFASRLFVASSESEATIIRVEGSAWGFCAAGLLILALALRLTGTGKGGGSHPAVNRYLLILGPMFAGQFLLNVLFQADALLLRRFAADAASVAGLTPNAADPYVGAYRAAQLFCFLPFQLLTSVTFVLFPLLAAASALNDKANISSLVERGLRIALLVAGLIISPVVAVPEGLLSLVMSSEASLLGAGAMRILAVGMIFFALLGVITSALNSLGRERQSFFLIGIAAISVVALCLFAGKEARLSPTLLTRVATATSAAMIAATFISAWRLRVISGGSLRLLSLIRVAAAVALCAVLGPLTFRGGHLMTLVGAVASALVFLTVLIVTGELKKADGQALLALVKR
jgi:stage V sporulation protein B